MAENSKIEWTTHTFNPWEGCQKVGPGCDNCYAEARDVRFTGGTHWGPGAPRRLTSKANWAKPMKWNRENRDNVLRGYTRPRVFCASLADVFDNAVDPQWRADLFDLIRITPHLDWLLLTKRPGNIAKMLPAGWGDGWANVWLGCTVVNQEEADRDIPKLLAVPAAVRFLSMEPLLGEVDLEQAWHGENALDSECWGECAWCEKGYPSLHNCQRGKGNWKRDRSGLDWVIVGGESGPHARPMHPDWARSLRDQCVAAGVPFLFKQWGEFGSAAGHAGHLKIDHVFDDGFQMIRFGKKAAGRTLDGVEWSQFPNNPSSAREASK